jgi:hypothetical protein
MGKASALEQILSGLAVAGLGLTSAKGNMVVKALRIYIKLQNMEFAHKNGHTNHPITGDYTYAINVVGDLCERSGVTSTTTPKILVALAYMMKADYHKQNGRDSESEYCKHVVENISTSGFTICEELINECKDIVREL